MSLEQETYYSSYPGLWESQQQAKQDRHDELHNKRFQADQRAEQKRRRETLTSVDVLEFQGLGVDNFKIMVDVSRGEGGAWGRAWVCKETFQDNVMGVIKEGSLLETRGKPNLTYESCCSPIEDETADNSGVAGFEIKVLTYRKQMKGVSDVKEK